jgi:dTDP-4-dehydrorhamnose 3,5-epimerase
MNVQFHETSLPGAFRIEPELIEDERGFFGRTFCAQEFERHGLNPRFVQCSASYNRRKGTLRGLHYQVAPHEEEMLVRCTCGAAQVVILDLRRASPTYRKWEAFEITASNRQLLYVPKGCADGFQTLQDDTEVFYQMSEFYHPESQRGVRYNDPAFGIRWPIGPAVLSARDQGFLDVAM